jgi:DUF1680 family protein
MAGDAISIAGYVPAVVPIPERNLTLSIRGGYPFADQVEVAFAMPRAASFPVDFALPAGAAGIRVDIGGRVQKLRAQPSGFLRLDRAWRPGERIRLVFEFPLRAHFRTGMGGKRWVAFTRGPILLASETAAEVRIRDGHPDVSSLVRCEKGNCRLIGGPELKPYYLAGSDANTGAWMYAAVVQP